MKNVMIIDGAQNCAYDVFAVTDDEFVMLFPGDGQDIAFIDEIVEISGSKRKLKHLFDRMWQRPVDKKTMSGLHGTIFYELDYKKDFYPTRRDSDLTKNRSRRQPTDEAHHG